ncbi:4-(cytidine 5'-diphospho)-2-C-methyl-D-erythritol kinase [Corynebacterium bovis]|uniref:4-(cytidine 5'-diphospho)-2-C-methyl-D-erythritol kinase n=1 Tax=Corynebacterium bovis TaxID=36808 RepID=UPI003139E256
MSGGGSGHAARGTGATGGPASGVSALAQGKVNLHLGVGDVRPDGYHDLVTVFQAVDLTERVTVTPVAPAPAGGASAAPDASVVEEVTVSGPDAHLVPRDASNLAVRAVDLLVRHWLSHGGVADVPRVAVHIDKGVPVAGGMAGGSADAAAALVATRELLRLVTPPADRDRAPDLDGEVLRTLGAELGADVPFCLLGGTALGTGRGEQLIPLMSRGTAHWALAFDSTGLSTAEVFARLDRLRADAATGVRPDVRAGDPHDLERALLTGDPAALAPTLVNDLQPAAVSMMPGLRRTLLAADEAGALAALVSGSGPTVAMLCRDHAHAVEVATATAAAGHVGSTTVTASSPHGARLDRGGGWTAPGRVVPPQP